MVLSYKDMYHLSSRNLIQYRIKMGTNQSLKEDDFGVVVMGSTKVGKTTFINHLLQMNDNITDPKKKIDTLFEYREYTRSKDDIYDRSQVPPLRSRAIEAGSLFVLLFSVNDIETFNFASDLRASIVEKKGEDVPVVFIGLKPGRTGGSGMTRSISYEFADLVVSLDLDSKYMELSFSEEKELSAIHGEILKQQQNHYGLAESKRMSNGGHLLHRLSLVSTEALLPDLVGLFKTSSNKTNPRC